MGNNKELEDKVVIITGGTMGIGFGMATRLAKYGGLPWDCIVGADVARDYKPKLEVYHASAAALRLRPDQVCMVAAHNDDLFAAREAGLRTAFVPRPTEHGPGQTSDLAPETEWDFVAESFENLPSMIL